MSLIAHPVFIKIRTLARQFGLSSILGKLLGKSEYEARFGAALKNAIKEGDCVWDVGANVGWYTFQFANWVGKRGHVVAFEPSSRNASNLTKAIETHPNLTVLPVGLSNVKGRAAFLSGQDQLGATSMILPNQEVNEAQFETIAVISGDEIIAKGQARFPHLVKIDVEGHELEVLEGMVDMFSRPELRNIFVEIHFAVLERHGRDQVPTTIESLLRSNGFRLKWLDLSHIHANR